MPSKTDSLNQSTKLLLESLLKQLIAKRNHLIDTYGTCSESLRIAIDDTEKQLQDLAHVLVKKECGFHYGNEPGPCKKCGADPEIRAAVQRILTTR